MLSKFNDNASVADIIKDGNILRLYGECNTRRKTIHPQQ